MRWSMTPPPRIWVARLCFVVTAAALCVGCGSSSGSPRQVATDYVAAINKHDGDRICDLFVTRLQKKYRYKGHSCGYLVGGFIGYGEESDTPTFVRGQALSVGRPYEQTSFGRTYTGVPIRLAYTFDDPSEDAPQHVRFRDILWLERGDGSWRIAKESLALYRAWAAYQIPDDVLRPPDPLAAQHAREAAARKRAEERSEYRRSFVTPSRRPLACARNASAFVDPAADVLTYGTGSQPARAPNQSSYTGLDVRRVRVEVRASRVCAAFRFAGRVKPPLRLALSLGDTANLFKCCATYELVWLAPGQIRYGSPASAETSDRQLRLIPIEGARIFLGARTITVVTPLPVELAFPRESIGWRATSGTGAGPAFGDRIPGRRGDFDLFVRQRDGRVLVPKY
jgi:hypothetical protein